MAVWVAAGATSLALGRSKRHNESGDRIRAVGRARPCRDGELMVLIVLAVVELVLVEVDAVQKMFQFVELTLLRIHGFLGNRFTGSTAFTFTVTNLRARGFL